MTEEDSALSLIGRLKLKTCNVSTHSTDVIVPVIMKAFDAMAALVDSQRNEEHIQRALHSFHMERDLSMTYDRSSDPIRGLMFDVLEGIYCTLRCFAVRRNEPSQSIDNMVQPNETFSNPEEIIDPDEIALDHVKDEPEVVEIDGIRPAADLSHTVENCISDEPVESVGMKEEEEEEVIEMGEEINEAPIDNRPAIPESTPSLLEYKGSSLTSRKRKRGGPAEKESLEFIECPLCKDEGGEWMAHSVHRFTEHLRDDHRTNMLEANLVYECECGRQHFRPHHFYKCASTSVAIVRLTSAQMAALQREQEQRRKKVEEEKEGKKREKKEKREAKAKHVAEFGDRLSVKPVECPICQLAISHPRHMTAHLNKKHGKSLTQMGMRIRCGCGHESATDLHWRGCNSAVFSLVEATKPAPPAPSPQPPLQSRAQRYNGQPKCPDCEYTSPNPHTMSTHFYRSHKKTMKMMGVLFRCGCGVVSKNGRHFQECNETSFTIVRAPSDDS